MTKLTSETWWDLREDKEFFTKLLEKAGCLLTVDGSGDKKIQPEDYRTMFFKVELCVASHIAIMFPC